MSGPTYEIWSIRSGIEWHAKRYLKTGGFDYAGGFNTQAEALAWVKGELDDSEAEEIAEALEYAKVSFDEDFTDPEYVSGVVSAAIEDLTWANKLAVLDDIRSQIMDPLWHLQQDHDVRIFFPDWMVGYVTWHPDPEAGEEGGWADLVDSKGVEAGATDSATCQTCGIELNVTEVLP